jgi:hypothetical protein
MANDPAQEIYDTTQNIQKYVSRLETIRDSYHYYNWFYLRLKALWLKIQTKQGELKAQAEDDKFLTGETGGIPDSDISPQLGHKYASLLVLFSQYHHIKTIYNNSSQNKTEPYFYDSPVFVMISKLFSYLNRDSSTFLIPPPYEFHIRLNGPKFKLDPLYDREIRRIINQQLQNPAITVICVCIKLLAQDRSTPPHENLLVFNKTTGRMKLIEPNIENQTLTGTEYEAYNDVLQILDTYRHTHFPQFTGIDYYFQQGLPYHGDLCAPVSVIMYFRPNVTYTEIKQVLNQFLSSQANEMLTFSQSLKNLANSRPNVGKTGGRSGVSSLVLSHSIYNSSKMPDADDYDESFSDPDDEASSGFGRKKPVKQIDNEIKYLLKLKG